MLGHQSWPMLTSSIGVEKNSPKTSLRFDREHQTRHADDVSSRVYARAHKGPEESDSIHSVCSKPAPWRCQTGYMFRSSTVTRCLAPSYDMVLC